MKHIIAIIVIVAGFIALLGYTDPGNVNIAIYLAVFGLVYAFCVISINLVVMFAYPDIIKTKRIFTSIVLGFSPVALLAIGTLSSIKILDVVLSIGVPSAIAWYGLKQAKNK